MNRIAKCACENVEVSVKGDPVRLIACHCDYCQRTSGSVATLCAVYEEKNILLVNGDTTVYELPKWPGGKKYFCSVCGTTVHWVNPGAFPGMHMIAAGCFADPNFPAPDTVTQTKYRQSWCPQFEGAEHYEEYSGK